MLKLEVIGNLGADAKLVKENGSSFLSFSVAHSESYQKSDGSTVENTQWVSCAYSKVDSNVVPYLVKGQRVFLRGYMSVRVYSSPKERKMVAGINLNVTEIELVGGKPDDVPHELYTLDGVLVYPSKHFFVGEVFTNLLRDRQGHLYAVDGSGWVSPCPDEQTESSATSGDSKTTGKV